MSLVDEFIRNFESADITPERLAIDIARIAYPTLDEPGYWHQLDALADYAARRMTRRDAGRGTAQAFLDILCQDLGFHGATQGYYDPRNSLMPDVLERRQGLPIMLALLCMAVGRRINLHIDGLGFPFHFMARYRDEAGEWLLDPFYGALVEPPAVSDYLVRIVGRPFQLSSTMWEPVSAQMLAVRVLNNLRNAFMTAENWVLALRTLDYLVAVQPQERQYWRERGLLHYKLEDWEQAQHDLRYYLIRSGLFPRIPHGSEESQPLTAENRRVVELYRTCGEMLMRVN
jgi:regulator of sirC expression with transglutaminase-like and TPR domain